MFYSRYTPRGIFCNAVLAEVPNVAYDFTFQEYVFVFMGICVLIYC